MEREEREREALFGRLYDAIDRGEFGDTFAGCWVDEELVFVAVTEMPERAKRVIAEQAPGAPVVLVLHRHSLAELEALSDELVEEAERLDAPLNSSGIAVSASRVDAMVTSFADSAAETLRQHFAGRPISWSEGTVEPA